ncbi:MAG: T9SS type A sorting domain-containing protein [Candidatus Eisenbacteria bacterium]|nr:T9SS type A sorting domain-containing protein [Candidatus Eisenbacteria bacterium]
MLATAHAVVPGLFVASSPDSASSEDNLPPGPPEDLYGWRIGAERAELHWSPSLSPDAAYYAVHRGVQPTFVPAPDNRLSVTSHLTFTDDAWRDEYTYKIITIDRHGLRSDPATLLPEQVLHAAEPTAPTRLGLSACAPSPFRSETQVVLTNDQSASVHVGVYDVAGHLVRRLFEGRLSSGSHLLTWNGVSDTGRDVPNGAYFVRAIRGNEATHSRVVLLR